MPFYSNEIMRVVIVLLTYMGLVGCATVNHLPDWRLVIPDQSDSQRVDVNSIQAHEGGWAAWISSSILDRDHPRGIVLPSGSTKQIRVHVDCGVRSASLRFLEVKLLLPSGEAAYAIKLGELGSEKYRSADGISYGADSVGLICAAATARCNGSQLQWPLRKTDVDRFVPTCKK
jgi:hypothetical protein